MNKLFALVAGLVLLGLLVLFSATYTVSFHQVAIKTRFGQTNDDSIQTDPGLKFKLPMPAEDVETLDTRLQLLTSPLETVPTADGQQVMIEAFLLWRVDTAGDGPLRFFRSFGASPRDASESMTDEFLTTLRRELSRYQFNELIGPGNRLAEAETNVLAAMRPATPAQSKGVEPVTVGISRIQLPTKAARAVLERMKATREKLSDSERYKGESEKLQIEAEAGTKADKIRAFALQRAEEIRAAGDEEAAKYLTQMSVDQDFAIFLVQLEALEASLGRYTTIVLDTANEPWHLLRFGNGRDSRGIPQPGESLLGDAPFASDSDPAPGEDETAAAPPGSPADESSTPGEGP
ncbi:MAG: SPFH domain-containing protein [Planctomycetota bacterium]|jgi:membrane protease subunit HflC